MTRSRSPWSAGSYPGPFLPGQAAEDFAAAFEEAVVSRVREAEVRIVRAEDVAGDDQEVVADGLGDEFGPRSPGGLQEQIERAARAVDLVVVLQLLDHQVA